MVKVHCTFYVDPEIIDKDELKSYLSDNNLYDILKNKIIDECFRETSSGHKLMSVTWDNRKDEVND